MSSTPTVRINVSGARGKGVGDVLRSSGLYGVQPDDSDAEAIAKQTADISASTLATSRLYASTAAGLAATTNGEYFSVPDTGEDLLILYRNNAGSAVEVNRYPSAAGIEAQFDALGTVAQQDADDLDIRVTKMRRPGFYNFRADSFPLWSAALARHRAGEGRAYIAVIGNSIARGVGSNPASATDDLVRRSWPSVMAKALSQMPDTKATAQSVWGDGFFTLVGSDNLAIADPRVSSESGWTLNLPGVGEQFVLGGHAFHDPAGNAGSPRFNFDPTEEDASYETDAARAVFVSYPGYASGVISTDATTFVGSQLTHGPAGIVVGEFTRSADQDKPWTVQKDAGDSAKTLTLAGFEAYVAADKPIGIYNMGASGSLAHHWTDDNQPYSFVNALPALGIHLTIVSLVVNDYAAAGGTGTVEADYKADMRLIIEAGKQTGDILLVVDPPSNTGTAATVVQQAFAGYVRDLADEYDLPVLDLQERWVAQAYLPVRGLYKDGLHPSNIGAADIGHLMAQVVGNPGYFFG